MASRIAFDMKPVVASQVHSVGHDADAKVMAVRFKNKAQLPSSLYHYSNITVEHFAEILAAERFSVAFRVVKDDPQAYPFEKIIEAETA